MLKQLRRQVLQHLWSSWCDSTDMQKIRQTFPTTHFYLDHFAIIDLPSPHSGIPILSEIFKAIEYTEKGQGYLPEKQNDFHWMSENHCEQLPVREALPQVVIADFRLHEMTPEVQTIIEKYGRQTAVVDLPAFRQQIERVRQGDKQAYNDCHQWMIQYFAGRDWPLPTTQEFRLVQAFNELLAWVLIFGRMPNHFTLSIHLLNQEKFQDLNGFLLQIEKTAKLSLNQKGGVIKGGKATGIAQAATMGITQIVQLADGEISLPTGFVEFVWRYPKRENPMMWGDYFNGFIPTHADRVIESLYISEFQCGE